MVTSLSGTALGCSSCVRGTLNVGPVVDPPSITSFTGPSMPGATRFFYGDMPVFTLAFEAPGDGRAYVSIDVDGSNAGMAGSETTSPAGSAVFLDEPAGGSFEARATVTTDFGTATRSIEYSYGPRPEGFWRLSGTVFGSSVYFNAIHRETRDMRIRLVKLPPGMLADATEATIEGGFGEAGFGFSAEDPATGAAGEVSFVGNLGDADSEPFSVEISIAPQDAN
jgi:hypothetical protein